MEVVARGGVEPPTFRFSVGVPALSTGPPVLREGKHPFTRSSDAPGSAWMLWRDSRPNMTRPVGAEVALLPLSSVMWRVGLEPIPWPGPRLSTTQFRSGPFENG